MGLTFTAGANGSAAMTVQGTLANINAALNGLTYTPPSNLTNNGSDTLTLVTNDLGNTGTRRTDDRHAAPWRSP